MVRIVTVDDIRNLIHKLTFKTFILKLIDSLEKHFANWTSFQMLPRATTHYSHGVIELMPISDGEYHSFKYVNGHPLNPKKNRLTVVAFGALADIEYGYPIFISEMTVLTACRTAAISAVASKYLKKPDAKTFGIIGTGAQSEFQVLAHHYALNLQEIYFFDRDEKAMQKFAENLKPYPLTLIPCPNAEAVATQSDILTTATAEKLRTKIIINEWVKPGCHINAIGGDCPGKTELDSFILNHAKIVVEWLEQTRIEGEIQHRERDNVYAELWELIAGKKQGRENKDEVTIFDSVGFALEDFSTLRLVHSLAEEFHVGHMLDLIPELEDPKNLFALLNDTSS